MKRVIVHIDRLVLNGFPRADRHAIAEGLREELGRVFGDRDVISDLRDRGDRSRMQVNGVPLEQGAKPQRVGENVAQGIGREIGT
jgi:hypothetical protein